MGFFATLKRNLYSLHPGVSIKWKSEAVMGFNNFHFFLFFKNNYNICNDIFVTQETSNVTLKGSKYNYLKIIIH